MPQAGQRLLDALLFARQEFSCRDLRESRSGERLLRGANDGLGFVARSPRPGAIWVHAVSVGEVQAAAGLVRALRRHRPDLPIVISTVTPTGAQRARALFKDDDVQQCYLPIDLPGAVRRFLDRVNPQVAVILETEIWPTLYAALGRRGVPALPRRAPRRFGGRDPDRRRGRYRSDPSGARHRGDARPVRGHPARPRVRDLRSDGAGP